jgi:hypothetical protein
MNAIASHIHRVQLYHHGATVTRRLELTPDASGRLPDTLEIPGLPLALHDDSVRLRVLGEARDAVLPRDLRVGLWVAPREAPSPEHTQQQLKVAQRKLLSLKYELAAVEAEAALLSTMDVPDRPRGDHRHPPPASPMSARLALDEMVDQAVQARMARHHALRDQIQREEELIASLRDALARISSASYIHAGEVSKTVVARLQWQSPVTGLALVLELDYFVPGARWAPEYQCRVNRAGDQAVIWLRAVIAQRTGEDWRGVQIKLSTADPHGFTELPELAAIRIGRAQPPGQKRGFRPPPQGAAALFGDYDQSYQNLPTPQSARWSSPSTHVEPLPADLWGDLVSQAAARRELRLSAAMAPMQEVSEDNADASRADYAAAESIASAAPPRTAIRAGIGGPSGGAPMPSPAPGMAAPAHTDETVFMRKMPKKSAPAMHEERLPKAEESYDEDDYSALDDARGADGLGSALRFGQLQLPPFWDAGRGKLRALDSSALYRELLGRAGRAPNFSVESQVAAMTSLAEQVGHLSLPQGCVDVRDAAGFFDYIYEADDPIDVPSDGVFHIVNLGVREAPCEVQYVVVPREDTHVFRVAHITNPTRAPMLPGPVEVYVQDEYILSTTLPSVAPRQQFRLGLGVEQSIKVARNTTYEERRSSETVVATAELWHAIHIELINNLGRTIPIEVRERLPQPAPKAEVVVEEHKVTPAWERWEQQEQGHKIVGGRRWNLSLEPGVLTKLIAEYVVKIYAKNELVGGNRREC